MNLKIRTLTLDEAEQIYSMHMKTDFPQNELRPFSTIKKLLHKNMYYTYGIFEEEELRAYAFFVEEPVNKILLFDYFAVCKSYRNKGYGRVALELIFSTCKDKTGIILEVEDPKAAKTEEDRDICQHRIAFYERCNIQMSEARIRLFGVHYCMMYKNLSGDISDRIIETMEKLYRKMLPGFLYKKFFHILSYSFLFL